MSYMYIEQTLKGYMYSSVVGVAVAYIYRRNYRGCSDAISNVPLPATYIFPRADKTTSTGIAMASTPYIGIALYNGT